MRPVRALRFLIPSQLEGSEAQLTEKQAVLSMYDIYTQNASILLHCVVLVVLTSLHSTSQFCEKHVFLW